VVKRGAWNKQGSAVVDNDSEPKYLWKKAASMIFDDHIHENATPQIQRLVIWLNQDQQAKA
jgi:hypothetical protein